MSEPDPKPAQPRPAAVTPLDYESPMPQWVRDRRRWQMGLLGAVLSAISAIGLVFLFIICLVGTEGAPAWFIVPDVCAAIIVVVLGGIAYWQWKRRGSTAFAAGLLIGLGVAALIEGLCYLVLSR